MTSAAAKQLMGPVEYFRAQLEYDVAPNGLKTILDRTPGVVCILDVREREEYDDGHLPGARNVPIDELVTAFSSLPKEKVIVAYSADLACVLSARAALELAQKGFRVQRLIGGLAEWSRKGYPLETSPGEAPSQAW